MTSSTNTNSSTSDPFLAYFDAPIKTETVFGGKHDFGNGEKMSREKHRKLEGESKVKVKKEGKRKEERQGGRKKGKKSEKKDNAGMDSSKKRKNIVNISSSDSSDAHQKKKSKRVPTTPFSIAN